jgi:hypothetical protein
VHKYREGKVKSTPMRGVKQNLKPDAYKQSEPALLRRVVFCDGEARAILRGREAGTEHRLTLGEPVTAYLLYNGSAT